MPARDCEILTDHMHMSKLVLSDDTSFPHLKLECSADIFSCIFHDVIPAVAPPFPFREAVSKAADLPVTAFISAVYQLDQPKSFCKFRHKYL